MSIIYHTGTMFRFYTTARDESDIFGMRRNPSVVDTYVLTYAQAGSTVSFSDVLNI